MKYLYLILITLALFAHLVCGRRSCATPESTDTESSSREPGLIRRLVNRFRENRVPQFHSLDGLSPWNREDSDPFVNREDEPQVPQFINFRTLFKRRPNSQANPNNDNPSPGEVEFV